MRMPLRLLFLLLLFNGDNLPAQNPYIQHYTTYDGLPTNAVYYIFQDSKKFIWFATDAGVVRYDGTTFTNFRMTDGLNSNIVIRIKEDSSGRIWFFNINSRLNFFYQNKIFNENNAPYLDSIKNKTFFIDFYQDEDKTIYFYNTSFELYSLDSNNKVNKYNLDHTLINNPAICKGMGTWGLRYLCRNKHGEFILWTACELFKLDSAFKNPVKIFDSAGIWQVYPTRNKSYYISALEAGILKFNSELQLVSAMKPFRMPDHYAGVKSVLEDNGGFLWIITYDKGVYCLRNNKIVRQFEIQEGQSVIQDNENNIWISSMKDGVYKISPYLNAHNHWESKSFGNLGITAMDAMPGVGLWLTNGRSIWLLNNNYFYTMKFRNGPTPFNSICQLKNNTLIVGERGSGYFAFRSVTKDPAKKQIIYKSSARSVKTLNKVTVNRTRDKISSFTSATLYLLNPEKLFDEMNEVTIGERINNTFYDINNDLVINAKKNYSFSHNNLSEYKELSRFDKKVILDHLILGPSAELFNIDGDSIYLYCKSKMINLTSVFRYPIDLQIRQIKYDDSTLYLSTNRNIYRCDNPLKILDMNALVLQLVDINFRNIHDMRVYQDSLYIASDDGLTIIPEAMINKMPVNIPIPYFKSILINDTETDPDRKEMHLTGDNKITIHFSCINYSSTAVQYLYKLEGADTGWTIASSTNVIFQNLRNGIYTFRLKVCKQSSQCSKPIEFKIIIKGHIWEHPLFVTAFLILALGMSFLIIIWRKNVRMKRIELDYQLITLEQKALQSMMNPHFIFNSLGSIQNYLLQNKSGEAGLYLSQFARLIRQNLNATNAASINLEEEIDRLRNYLDLEKMRMENKFEYRIEVDPEIEAHEVQIPSMIIQPFVENSIWHGIAGLEEKGLVKIIFHSVPDRSMQITIEDNGIGMKRSAAYSSKSGKHLHLGMEMTRKRLDILGKKFKSPIKIEFSEMYPGSTNPGTKVVLVVPVSQSSGEF
jgi:hypothetical protein